MGCDKTSFPIVTIWHSRQCLQSVKFPNQGRVKHKHGKHPTYCILQETASVMVFEEPADRKGFAPLKDLVNGKWANIPRA